MDPDELDMADAEAEADEREPTGQTEEENILENEDELNDNIDDDMADEYGEGAGESVDVVDDDRKDGTEGDSAAEPRTLKRPMSAYFLFAAAIRPAIQADLDAEAAKESEETGREVKSKSRSLATVGKIVGDKWKEMTEEEKEVWTAQAQAAKEAYDEAIRLDPSLKAVRVSKDGAGGGAAGEFVIPLGRIKKIIDLDKDKGKVNKEAVCVLEKAAERFLLWLATRSHLHATSQKRKGVRAQDFEHLVRSDRRLEFLRAPFKRDFERFAQAEAATIEARKAKKAKAATENEEEEGEADADQEEHKDSLDADAEGATAASKPKPKAITRTIDSMFARK